MLNKYVLGVSNTENIFWIRLKPNVEVVRKIDSIIKKLDVSYGEGIFHCDEDIENYKSFFPRRCFHDSDGVVYAISIFNEDLIDFILIKESPVFNQLFELYQKEFEN